EGCYNQATWSFRYGTPYTKELEKIGRESVAEALEGKNVVKVIAVPNKLVNIVVK
ncbi:4Fe-4S cluster-binding domain-containing protein, partial [Lactococcus lactis]